MLPLCLVVIVCAGPGGRGRSASSVAALLAAKTAGDHDGSVQALEALLEAKDAEIQDLLESNRYFLKKAKEHDTVIAELKAENAAILKKREEEWALEKGQLLNEKDELLAVIERLEDDLDAATQDTQRFGVSATSPAQRRPVDADDIDELMRNSTGDEGLHRPVKKKAPSSSASTASTNPAAVTDCMTWTLE